MKKHGQAVLGLGSNIGDRLGNIYAAISALTPLFTETPRISPLYESPALLLPGAPADWDIPFYNMAIAGPMTLTPQALLGTIKSLEKSLGRQDRGAWAPREIDIDILALGDMVLHKPGLILPHPELLNRDFAYLPFADLWPDWMYPLEGKYYKKRFADIINGLPRGNTQQLPSSRIV